MTCEICLEEMKNGEHDADCDCFCHSDDEIHLISQKIIDIGQIKKTYLIQPNIIKQTSDQVIFSV